jgi:two-component system response regulator YesN
MLLKILNPLPESEIEGAYRSFAHRLQYKSDCLFAIIAGQMILLFHEADESDKLEKHIEKALESVGKFDCRFGLGPFRHYSALNESYREALDQLRNLEGKAISGLRQMREIRDLCDKFHFSDWDEVQPLYEKHWTDIFMSNDFLVAKAKMVAFFVQLMNELDKDPKLQCDIDMDPAEEIIGLSTVQKWQQWSDYMMDRLRFIIKENKDQYYPKPLSLAVNYIKENYTKPLHLSLVAEQCEISQGYLSRLFSEYLNTTFIDYLNTLRLNEAVKLLRNERKSVKDVAYLVGYTDPNYFSRIFRRHLNVSPSELAKGGLES